MNIVMFVDKFHPFIGGVEKHTLNLATKLIEDGNKVTIITRNTEGVAIRDKYNDIDIIRINMSPKLTLLKIYCGVIKNIKEIVSADIIHFHDYSTFYYWYLPFRYLIFWKKYYITFHGWEGVFPPNKKIINIRKKCEYLTRGNICVGKYIENWYGTKATKIIYGATNFSNKTLIKKNKNKILYLGRLEKDTGILKYIEVLGIIKKKHNIDFEFEICGDGSLRDAMLDRLNSLDIKYIFNGFVENSDYYLEKSNICFTSGYLGIIEAMNNENIVVSVYDNDLKKDYLYMLPCSNEMIIGDSEYLLAEEIADILKNDDLFSLKIKLAKEWSQNQTWKMIAKTYLDLWRN